MSELADTQSTALDAAQQAQLLDLTRDTIVRVVSEQSLPRPTLDDPLFRRPTAVFVTLWQSGDRPALRGCIGRVEADLPLYQALIKAAAGAATRDPRFPPVSAAELPDLNVEITLLSPMTVVHDLSELLPGRDGAVIEAWGRRALLLPSVAPRLGWDSTDLLNNLCRKAGLPADTWPAAGTLYRFQAVSFRAPLLPHTPPAGGQSPRNSP